MTSRKKVYPERSRRVFVGLSGGVDSAVSAALLKKEGYDVTGVFIKAWTPPGHKCSWKEDRRSAMRVAAVLDIPFITLDLEKEYKKEVVDYMIREYRAGRTPNPDVMCNKEIKFGHFLKWALKRGADFVATGHYARNELMSTDYELWEGTDKNKDQSYFLWTLTQNQLKHILFPIGHLQKAEVRKLAKKFGLPQAEKKDSQGVCFLGQIDMKEFLKEFVGTKEGKVLNEKGEVIGKHEGAILYTTGERHGFAVTNKNDKNEPLYVIAKDIKKNTITVASKPHPHSPSPKGRGLEGEAKLININFISKIPDKNLLCRIRYRGEKIPCKIEKNKVTLNKPCADIASGQSLVLYNARPNGSSGRGEICLGGGIIDSTSSL